MQSLLKEHSETRGNILNLISGNARKALVYPCMLSSRVSDTHVVCQERIPVLFTNIKLKFTLRKQLLGKVKALWERGKGLLFSYQLILGIMAEFYCSRGTNLSPCFTEQLLGSPRWFRKVCLRPPST